MPSEVFFAGFLAGFFFMVALFIFGAIAFKAGKEDADQD